MSNESRHERSAPHCPACGYCLTGLASTQCPECGLELGDDLSRYRNVVVRTPWAKEYRRWLIAGYPVVFFTPMRAMRWCVSPVAVATTRATLFGLVPVVLTILLWGQIRDLFVETIGVIDRWSQLFAPATVLDGLKRWCGDLAHPRYRTTRYMGWELWSISRWVLLFGLPHAVITHLSEGPPRELRPKWVGAWCRFMLFAPWLIFLELGFLIGVWADPGSMMTVPEPSTIFVARLTWSVPYRSVWLIRGIAPTFVVGIVFFRAVSDWKWRWAIPSAALLVPVALHLSTLWSWLYLQMIR